MTDELERILANWIEQALSPVGNLPGGVGPASFVAARFADWWRREATDALEGAESAASAVQDELIRLDGWRAFGEALHEISHVRAAHFYLRKMRELPTDAQS